MDRTRPLIDSDRASLGGVQTAPKTQSDLLGFRDHTLPGPLYAWKITLQNK